MGITQRYCFGVENSTIIVRRRRLYNQYCPFVTVDPDLLGVAIFYAGTGKLPSPNAK
jgi:hypothetical protein